MGNAGYHRLPSTELGLPVAVREKSLRLVAGKALPNAVFICLLLTNLFLLGLWVQERSHDCVRPKLSYCSFQRLSNE